MEEADNDFMYNQYAQANQQGEGNDPNSLYADMMREDRIKNVIAQLNPDILLEDIEHRIRGEIKDRYTQEWKTIGKNKEVSEQLLANYISYLGSILNQNTSLSNFSTTEINNLMTLIIEHLKDDLSDNDELYGFVKVKEINIITTIKKLIPVITNEGYLVYDYIEQPIEQTIELERVVDYNEMNRIGNIICMATFAVFKRAQNGMEARRIFGALKVSESLSPTQQKKGIFDFLKFGG